MVVHGIDCDNAMVCYYPLTGFRAKERGPSGKRAIVFDPTNAYRDRPIELPCGQCIGCRLEKSRQWALRCMHEASLHDDNCFLTLTYSDENLPNNNSLELRHFQLFMKRLRKIYGSGIRYFHCGEYGEKNGRPHYHAILFNHDFDDKVLFSVRDGNNLYISENLSNLWPFGFCTIGDVTFESAAYVARYCLKKVVGQDADEYYTRINEATGELVKIKAEYATMSRRPGIGHEWYKKWKSDVYPSDFIVRDGVKMKPPKAYDKYLEAEDPAEHRRISNRRVLKAKQHAENNTSRRLRVREEVQLRRSELLKRSLEDDNEDL